MNFWEALSKPIIGLAPMDGITDFAYREIQAKYGRPSVIFTEFIPVDGLVRLSQKLLQDCWYTEIQKPIVAQLYGNDPTLFYPCAQLLCELGFDGIDINMGCPAKSVVHRGCGAALIENPDLARTLITTTRMAVSDWQNGGINWSKWPVMSGSEARADFEKFIQNSQSKGFYLHLKKGKMPHRLEIPISVKTRVGISVATIENWLEVLLATRVSAVTIHGRTLKQMYSGKADWEVIKRAVIRKNFFLENIAPAEKKQYRPIILGNGNITGVEDAGRKVIEAGVDGVLVGRGSFGNPWVFSKNFQAPGLQEITQVALEHARLQENYKPAKSFVQIRKNLAWYVKGLPYSNELKAALVQVNSVSEINEAIKNYQKILESQ